MTDMPVWERRFRAPKMTLPHWSRAAPDRAVFASNVSGVWQVHAWDVATALGRTWRPDPELVAVVLEQARSIPAGPARCSRK